MQRLVQNKILNNLLQFRYLFDNTVVDMLKFVKLEKLWKKLDVKIAYTQRKLKIL